MGHEREEALGERAQHLLRILIESYIRDGQPVGSRALSRTRQAAIAQIGFVGLSENRVLVVLVFNDREVQNRVIQLERHFSPDELKRASNYLNEQFRGRSLPEARQEILRQLSEAHAHMNQIMLEAISVAQQVFESGAGESRLEYVIKGETNLMGAAELTSVEKLRRLFEAFNEKRDFLHLLDQSLKAEGVQIFIGHESGYQILDDCSVVTAPYADGESVLGVLGVIGPTRMSYEQVIPIVEMTAKLLGAALNSRR